MDVAVDPMSERITAIATTTEPEADCPVCQQSSARIQSRYTRTLADLPWAGRHVQWRVQVRRFRCENVACPRKIFTEQLPMRVPAYAHRTRRQAKTLRNVAYALGGKGGERLVTLLGMAASYDTLLRLLRRSETTTSPPPRVLGFANFAWKKGDRYCKILIDQERHTVVDVLPDREAATLATWLKAHEGVEIISRDRAGAYAEGARQGTPQATRSVIAFICS
jgi:transposase